MAEFCESSGPPVCRGPRPRSRPYRRRSEAACRRSRPRRRRSPRRFRGRSAVNVREHVRLFDDLLPARRFRSIARDRTFFGFSYIRRKALPQEAMPTVFGSSWQILRPFVPFVFCDFLRPLITDSPPARWTRGTVSSRRSHTAR